MDPAIHARFNEGYAPLDTGLEMGVFVTNQSGGVLVGNVWPGDTVFPDFLSNDTSVWWSKQIAGFYEELQLDGFWNDMNEPQSFYCGSDVGCPWEDTLETPPYTPGNTS